MERRGSHNPPTESPRAPPKPARHDGPTHIGRFSILDRIGAGAMGELFLGWDSQLDRKLAIKLVHARSSSSAAEERLRLEAKALAQLSHPNVVQVFEVGSHAGRVYVAMEFVEGKSLRDWLAALEIQGAARVAAIVDRFVAAGRGLEAVHGSGLIHRDFKPSNVVVGDDGRVRIIDFGLASELDEGADETPPQMTSGEVSIDPEPGRWDATLTDTGVLLGTPRYMAPEQWRGRPGDLRSDQFAWCVALFEALYAVHPFEHAGIEGLAKRASSTLRRLGHKVGLAEAMAGGEIEPPAGWGEVPTRVREALVRGLSLDPEHRFGSMSELLDHIAPPASSGRWAIVAGGSVVLVLALAMVLLLAPGRNDASTDSAIAHARLEAVAARDLVRVEQRVAELTAQGKITEADETFAAYAELPDYAATGALGRGWLNQGARLAERGDLEGQLDAYGAAYLSASPDIQRDALFGLARVFERTRQWTRLRATVDTLETLSEPLDATASAELCGMRVIELASRRELAEAAKTLDRAASASACEVTPAFGAAIAELAQVTPTEHDFDGFELRVEPLPGLDLDGDGVGELIVYNPGVAQLSVLDSGSPTLEVLQHIAVPEPLDGLSIVPGALEPIVALRQGGRLSLHRVDTSVEGALALTQLYEYEQDHGWPTRWTAGDLDGNGGLEFYASLTPKRRLLATWPGETGWISTDPHPATSAANSVPYDMTIGDFDGDHESELAVAVGEWSAYDLRILGRSGEPDPTLPGPTLELLGRRKLGTVQSIAKIPAPTDKGMWLAVGVSAQYPSRRVFPNPPAHGVPGVYVFAWDGKALEQVAFVDVSPPDLMFTGDFNKDGLSDLALASHPLARFETTILIQTSPGVFEPMMLVEMWPIGVVDRDRNGDDELLALDTTNTDGGRLSRPGGRLYVLGSGDGRIPGIAGGESTTGQTIDAPVEDAAFRAAIGRAEDLATIGLPLSAAAELRKLARVAAPDLAAHLSLRAAELLEGSGHRLAAAELYAQASADPSLIGVRAGETRLEAMKLYEQVHRFRAAADMAAAARELAGDDTALAADHARLEALAHDEPQLVFDFDQPLDDGWTIDPLAVRRRMGRLELSLGSLQQDVVARRELHWDGGRLALEVELEVELIEWSGAIEVVLHPVGGPGIPVLPVGAATLGGGGLYHLALSCVGDNVPEPGAEGLPIVQPQAELPEGNRKFRLRAELVPNGGGMWCTAEGSGVHAEVALPAPALAPGRYELLIRGSSIERWSRAAANIDRIVITGARDLSETERSPAPPAAAFARGVAEGRMEDVLASLDADTQLEDRERALLRFIALDELGRPEEREAALIAALGNCSDDQQGRVLAGRLLRHRPEHLGPDLYRLCGTDEYFSILSEVWANAIYQHPDSTTVGRVLTTQTPGLERWLPEDPADHHKVLTLLCARARARASLGTPGPNRADLERAVQLGDRWLAEGNGNAELASQLGRCRVDLAAERLDRGEADGAIETLRDTLRRSPAMEILADMLTIDPRFASLRERTAWRELIEPARAGVDLDAAHR